MCCMTLSTNGLTDDAWPAATNSGLAALAFSLQRLLALVRTSTASGFSEGPAVVLFGLYLDFRLSLAQVSLLDR